MTFAIQSWIEPPSGHRLEWKSDRWKYVKLGMIPVMLFSIAALRRFRMSPTLVEWLAGSSGVVMALVWLMTFIPRRIAVFEDRVEITTFGRGASTRRIFYSDVRGVGIEPYKTRYRVTVQWKTRRGILLVARDLASAEGIRDMFEKYNSVANKPPQPTPGGFPGTCHRKPGTYPKC